MPQTTEDADSADQRALVLAGVQAAGPPARGNITEWRTHVNDMIRDVGAMLAPRSREMVTAARMLTASFFVAEIVDVRIEESSTRGVVTLKSDSGDNDTEELRTDRTDTPQGRSMVKLCTELKGCRCAVWKAFEPTGNKAKPNVRVLAHVSALGGPKPPGASDTRPAQEADIDVSALSEYASLFARLTGAGKVEAARKAATVGIPNLRNPVGRLAEATAIISDYLTN